MCESVEMGDGGRVEHAWPSRCGRRTRDVHGGVALDGELGVLGQQDVQLRGLGEAGAASAVRRVPFGQGPGGGGCARARVCGGSARTGRRTAGSARCPPRPSSRAAPRARRPWRRWRASPARAQPSAGRRPGAHERASATATRRAPAAPCRRARAAGAHVQRQLQRGARREARGVRAARTRCGARACEMCRRLLSGGGTNGVGLAPGWMMHPQNMAPPRVKRESRKRPRGERRGARRLAHGG
jgi:hypothetical protein